MGLLSTIGAASGRAFGFTRSAIAAATDAFFNRVTLLLPGNGTNGAQNNTFLDSSSNNFTITRNGNTTQGTFSPFSQTGWSNFFNGSTDYISVADNAAFTLGSGDFTIEFWVYSTTAGTRQFFAGQMNSAGANISVSFSIEKTSGNKLLGAINSGTTQYAATSSGDIPLNAWTHIALVRDGNTLRQYINGVQDGTVSVTGVTANDSSSQLAIGRIGEFTSNYYFGYISNFRFVKGTCLYTGGTTFTPPTSPLTNITNTSLLTCQSNRFIDNSTNAFTITVNGTPSVQAFSPFAPTAEYSAATVGGSGYFDGSTDSLASATSFEASTSTSTFTIEGWIYPTTFSTLINIIGGMVVSSGDAKSIAAEVNTSGQVALYWFDGAIKRCTGNTVMQLNAWNYFAIVVNSNAISIYVNKTTADTLSGTTTLTNRTQSTTLGVGAYYNNNTPAQYFNGYLSNIRVSTVARTISAVPTAPLTSDANVRWLFNFTNAGITDATAKNDLETVGNAQISTTQSKFGGSSMYFDGTGDYLVAPNSQNFALGSGDFTVEAWVYVSASKLQAIMDTRAVNSNTTGIALAIDASNYPYVYVNNSTLFTSSTAISLSTWTHLAMVRSGGTITLYINGVKPSTGSGSNSTNLTDTALTVASVIDYRDTSATLHFNGYIDDLRITKGYARYTANFTAPTAALPLQ